MDIQCAMYNLCCIQLTLYMYMYYTCWFKMYTVFLFFTLYVYLNFRGYFESAHQSYKNHGDASELYVIIIDEIEAICKPRGNMQHI